MKIEDFKKNQDWIMHAFLNNKKVAFIDEYGDIVDKAKCIEIRYAREIMFVSNIYQVYPKIKQNKIELRVKNYKELVMQLLDEGYRQNIDGHWSVPKEVNNMWFYFGMFEPCGKVPMNVRGYKASWLEEVEIE